MLSVFLYAASFWSNRSYKIDIQSIVHKNRGDSGKGRWSKLAYFRVYARGSERPQSAEPYLRRPRPRNGRRQGDVDSALCSYLCVI